MKADIETWDLLKEVDKLCAHIPGWIPFEEPARHIATHMPKFYNLRGAVSREKARNKKRVDIKRR